MDPTEAPAPETTPETPPKRKRGRPSKLTPEVTAKVVAAIEGGQFLAVAARLAGIGPTTLHRWMERGEKKGKGNPFRAFYIAVQRAEARNEQRLVKLWRRQAKDDWRAAMEMLARRHPERWSPPKDRVELDASVTHGGAVRVWLPPEDS
jgi:transposase-like protein